MRRRADFINFAEIKQRYTENPLPILRQLVGQGKIERSDYVALNPRRNDRHRGSFRIKISTGGFYDFATGDKGGSILDLAMFVYNCGIVEAAEKISDENWGQLKNRDSFWDTKYPYKSMGCAALSPNPQFPEKNRINPKFIWERSAAGDHPYLRKKKISIGNARVNFYKGKSQLVIPLTDRVPDESVPEKYDDLEIKGLQFIDEDGQKRFFGSFKGLMHIASYCGESKDTIIICEGYATARSIVQALDTESKPLDRSTHNTGTGSFPGKPLDSCTLNTASRRCLVLGAMSSINIKNVAEKIAEQFPNSEIIIAADNDEAGRKAVTEAQKAISGKVSCVAVYPSPEFNDFNDMYQAKGKEEIRKIFELAKELNNE